MGLLDELNKVNEMEEQRDSTNVDYPSSHLKNQPLRITQNNPKVVVRILPATSPDEPTWAGFREFWTQDGDNKHSFVTAVSNNDDDPDAPRDVLLDALNRWSKTKYTYTTSTGETDKHSGLWKLDKKYGSYPSLNYYVNVIPLEVDPDNEMRYRECRKPDGSLDIRLFKLKNSMLTVIANDMQNKMINPNLIHQQELQAQGITLTDEQIVQSFISDLYAYPIQIQRVKNNKKVEYYTQVQTADHLMLNPLPAGWQNGAEDLALQSKPSYLWNRHWVDQLIDRIDNELGLTSHIDAPTQAPTQSAPQDPFANKAVPNNAQQAPTQPKTMQQGTPNSAQPNAPVPPKQSVPTAQAPAPQAPTSPEPTNFESPIVPEPLSNDVPQGANGTAVDAVFPDLSNIANDNMPNATAQTTTPQAQTQPTGVSNGQADNEVADIINGMNLTEDEKKILGQ